MKKIRIGTRTSALAMTQTEWVAERLKEKHPDLVIEIVGIKVSADEGLDTALSKKPLWQLDEKNVFSRELDDALLQGLTDCSIHSFKDLSTDRPEGIQLAAIPGRENPHDIALFHPRVIDKLKNGQTITIGTSAPRRMTNVAPFLEKALPHFNSSPPERQREGERLGEGAQMHSICVETKPIRGNVDSRIKRLFEPETSDRYVDGVVLALAGISRLYNNGFLREILPQLRRMLLPLMHCPAAPAQGALAIECRSNDRDALQLLSVLHDKAVETHIQKEREQLVKYGGGCHQAFGATSVPHPRFANGLMYLHGKSSNGVQLNDLIWDKPVSPKQSVIAWDGMAERHEKFLSAAQQGERLGEGVERNVQMSLPPHPASPPVPLHSTGERGFTLTADAIFISHARASEAALDQLQSKRIWTSGAESWIRMAEKGLWIEGCGDGLGIEFLRKLFATPCLELPEWKDWIVLTNDEAKNGWKESTVIGTYKINFNLAEQSIAELQNATHIFWGSSFQFDQYHQYADESAHHACGAGKTADHLERQNLKNFDIFPNRREWQKWISQ